MKNEIGGKVIFEFIGLKSKMYSLITVDDEEKTKAKGLSKKLGLKYSKFFDVLFDKKIVRNNMKRIQAKKHRLCTYDVCKVSLSCFDDKRYLLDIGVIVLLIFIKILYIVCDYL